MDFIDGKDKIVQLRKKLNIRQKDLECPGLSSSYLGLLERGNRIITASVANILASKFNEILNTKHIQLPFEITPHYFLSNAADDARVYCNTLLENPQISNAELSQCIEVARKFQLNNTLRQIYFILGENYYKKMDYSKAVNHYMYLIDLIDDNDYI